MLAILGVEGVRLGLLLELEKGDSALVVPLRKKVVQLGQLRFLRLLLGLFVVGRGKDRQRPKSRAVGRASVLREDGVGRSTRWAKSLTLDAFGATLLFDRIIVPSQLLPRSFKWDLLPS